MFVLVNEKFSFTETKPKIDFFFQISVQFGRRAAKRRGGKLDLSESVDYS